MLSVINVALLESSEKDAPSQRVLSLFDDEAIQTICSSLLLHASSIVRAKTVILVALLMRTRPLALLPMFAKKLAQGLEKAAKDTDPYVAAAATALAAAVDEFIPPSIAVLQKEVLPPPQILFKPFSCYDASSVGVSAQPSRQPRHFHMLPAQTAVGTQPHALALRAQGGGRICVFIAEAAARGVVRAVRRVRTSSPPPPPPSSSSASFPSSSSSSSSSASSSPPTSGTAAPSSLSSRAADATPPPSPPLLKSS
jgi:hypothetical protein